MNKYGEEIDFDNEEMICWTSGDIVSSSLSFAQYIPSISDLSVCDEIQLSIFYCNPKTLEIRTQAYFLPPSKKKIIFFFLT